MLTIALASTAYTAFALLDISHDHERLLTFRIVVGVYALIMTYQEIISLQTSKARSLPFLNYLAIMGYLTILASACFTPSFLHGSSYLVGFFLVTLSVLARILLQVASSVKRSHSKLSPCFFRLISTAGVGYCLFANATVRAIDGHNTPRIGQIGEYGMAIGILLHWSMAYFNQKE